MAWLSGWKAISAYIGKHTDTCRRWRDRYGMPIHRDPGGGPVAFPEELDAWIKDREKKMKKGLDKR